MKKHLLVLLTLTASFFLHAQQQLPNGSFENWTNNSSLSYDELDTWFGSSIICTGNSPTVCNPTTVKTTDANIGLYAANLVNIASAFDKSIVKGLLLYSPQNDGYKSFANKPVSLTGYYKFNKTNNDKITINITLTGNSSTDFIAYGELVLTKTKTEYTKFTVPITYLSGSAPKDINVIISFNDNPSVSSDFTVDNLVFTYATIPTSTATPVTAGIQFFPNPSTGQIHFEKPVSNIAIQTANGSTRLTQQGDTDAMDISTLEKGIYIITYAYNELLIHGKLIVE